MFVQSYAGKCLGITIGGAALLIHLACAHVKWGDRIQDWPVQHCPVPEVLLRMVVVVAEKRKKITRWNLVFVRLLNIVLIWWGHNGKNTWNGCRVTTQSLTTGSAALYLERAELYQCPVWWIGQWRSSAAPLFPVSTLHTLDHVQPFIISGLDRL